MLLTNVSVNRAILERRSLISVEMTEPLLCNPSFHCSERDLLVMTRKYTGGCLYWCKLETVLTRAG